MRGLAGLGTSFFVPRMVLVRPKGRGRDGVVMKKGRRKKLEVHAYK